MVIQAELRSSVPLTRPDSPGHSGRMIRYTQDHEWVRREADGIFTVGITVHAQEQLGDLVFIELPAPGRRLATGDGAAVVESTKAASDVYAPLTGEVTEVNATVTDEPAIVNADPLNKGWLYRMRVEDADEFEALLTEEAYAALLRG